MTVIDLAAFENAVRSKQKQLEALPDAPWSSITTGRVSGLYLALALLRDHVHEEVS